MATPGTSSQVGGPSFDRLPSLTPGDIAEIFTAADIEQKWNAGAPRLAELCRIEDGKTGGVNPGDRRALFYLVTAFRPEKVLARLARNREAIATVMEEELRRFAGGYSLEYWRANVARAEKFASERGDVFRRQMESHLSEPFRLPVGFGQEVDFPVFIRQGGAVPVPVQQPRVITPRTKLRIEEEE